MEQHLFEVYNMKINRIAINTQYDNLPEGTVVISDLYRREGNITLQEREVSPDPLGGEKIKYRALFTNTGRAGFIEPRDITSIVS